MKTKYDWSGVPLSDKWIATDVDGWAFGWREKPRIANSGWRIEVAIIGEHYLPPWDNPYQGNWQDSLEERPSE